MYVFKRVMVSFCYISIISITRVLVHQVTLNVSYWLSYEM